MAYAATLAGRAGRRRDRSPAVAAVVAVAGSPAPAASWTLVASTAPVPLTEVAVAERTAAGSGSPAGCGRTGPASDEVFIFDPAAGTWTDRPELPEAVHHAALVSTPAGWSWSAATSATP